MLEMLNDPPYSIEIVRECRRIPFAAQTLQGEERRAPLGPIQHAQHIARCGTFANIQQPRKRRCQLHRPPAQVESPAQRIDRRARLPLARHPLGMARGEAQRLNEFGFTERTGQEMRRAGIVEARYRLDIAARHQRQQRTAIRHNRTAQRLGSGQSIGQRAPRIDHRDRRSAGEKTPFRPFRPPRRDHLPSGIGGERCQFVALTEGQDVERGGIGFSQSVPFPGMHDVHDAHSSLSDVYKRRTRGRRESSCFPRQKPTALVAPPSKA